MGLSSPDKMWEKLLTPIPVFLFLLCFFLGTSLGNAAPGDKKRIIVVDSYHREYLGSINANRGFCRAMLHYGYFDSDEQEFTFTRDDFIESSQVIVKKLWLDSKRKQSTEELLATAKSLAEEIQAFNPDLILLGDDNAVNYIGTLFLDQKIPIVFWESISPL